MSTFEYHIRCGHNYIAKLSTTIPLDASKHTVIVYNAVRYVVLEVQQVFTSAGTMTHVIVFVELVE